MIELILVIKFPSNFHQQRFLNDSEVVNEVLLQKMRLSKEPRETDAVVIFEKKIIWVDIFKQVTKEHKCSFLRGKT
jgi:hypothetical protein